MSFADELGEIFLHNVEMKNALLKKMILVDDDECCKLPIGTFIWYFHGYCNIVHNGCNIGYVTEKSIEYFTNRPKNFKSGSLVEIVEVWTLPPYKDSIAEL
jgi:hypothetical protein